MMSRNIVFPVTIFFIIMIFTNCAKNTFNPLPASKLSIRDGEILTYGLYKGGEKTYEEKLVARIYPESNTLILYMNGSGIKEHRGYPSHYTNFSTKIVVSLNNTTMLSYHFDDLTNGRGNKSDFPDYMDIFIDRTNQTASILEKKWNNGNIITTTSRMPVKPGYSVWDMNSLGFICARFLDLKQEGVVYAIIPVIIKEPVLCSFRYLGKETITVKAGRFDTLKFGFSIADPFLSSLLSQYTKIFLVWKEDNARGLIIKTSSPWGSFSLESIGEWKN